ncbi:hypothetical protein BMETH_303_0 [methanotrophic bacterial endosymbiont of Bathymodiolus sp.]|nr:hypothetical protein BMETH_303_0 [methanotrophic bacterial endosymbiont of Bathymodiolus sp.]
MPLLAFECILKWPPNSLILSSMPRNPKPELSWSRSHPCPSSLMDNNRVSGSGFICRLIRT